MRVALTIEYHGAYFSGWQRLHDAATVQEAMERALLLLYGSAHEVVAAGRTDAGVHAEGQVAHMDVPDRHDLFTIQQALNHLLLQAVAEQAAHYGQAAPCGRAVSVRDLRQVDDTFHARFSATRRHYRYRILNRRTPSALTEAFAWHVPLPLDIAAMQDAAVRLLGTHDFTSFRDSQCQAKSPIRTLDACKVTRHGDELHVTLHARSFLHHQVRIIAGTLMQVGLGRIPPTAIQDILQTKDRTRAGMTAPPHGLCLTRVDYD